MNEYESAAKRVNDALADVLDGERRMARHTFVSLAKESGISKRTLVRLLSEKSRDIDVTVLSTLAQIYRTTPTQLIAAAEERMARDQTPTGEHAKEAATRGVRKSLPKTSPKVVTKAKKSG